MANAEEFSQGNLAPVLADSPASRLSDFEVRLESTKCLCQGRTLAPILGTGPLPPTIYRAPENCFTIITEVLAFFPSNRSDEFDIYILPPSTTWPLLDPSPYLRLGSLPTDAGPLQLRTVLHPGWMLALAPTSLTTPQPRITYYISGTEMY